jgi:hypothetical protein
MSENATIIRVRTPRRALGIALLVLTVAVAVGFAAGVWNPWRLVVLSEYFGSFPLGLLVISVLAFATSWVLLPVRHEVAQGLRIKLRIATGVAILLSLFCVGFTGSAFLPATSTVLARSPDGQRAVALVERGLDDRKLQVWVGAGLAAREAGDLGPACGPVTVRFDGPDRVAISTNYGDFQLRLDPATGVPLDGIGSHCSGGG